MWIVKSEDGEYLVTNGTRMSLTESPLGLWHVVMCIDEKEIAELMRDTMVEEGHVDEPEDACFTTLKVVMP